MRFIDFSRGENSGPYTIQKEDVFRIFKTEMLFARKFDYDKYPDAVNKVLDLLSIRDK
ncbi:MAG: hypothetical protein ACLRXX_06355 [Coprococcus phoceensis]